MNSVVLRRLSDAEPGALGYDCIIDVRSPSEFAHDRIPGSINLPVLDDAERATVGTIYRQQCPFAARKVGASLVARNAARHLEGALANFDKQWRPLLYCWRGGQRSNSFAMILAQIGWKVGVVDGGYKSWRRLVNDALEAPVKHRLVLLDGNTGTAKTAVLAKLAAAGAQVIDLEAMAHHRGSIFGRRAAAQPSQQNFESSVARAISAFDVSRHVVLEAESARIGSLHVPATLRCAMAAAPRVEISAPLTSRAKYLVEAYSDIIADPARLTATIDRLRPLHSADTISMWHCLAASGQHEALALQLVQLHYDPSYARSRARGRQPACRIEAASLNAADISDIAASVARAAEYLAQASSGEAPLS